MFWSAFLATYAFGETRTNQHTAAILAALLHDLARQREWGDQGHGERSLEKHRKFIERALPDLKLRTACANAVRSAGSEADGVPGCRFGATPVGRNMMSASRRTSIGRHGPPRRQVRCRGATLTGARRRRTRMGRYHSVNPATNSAGSGW
jgi:hypothetical protein